MASCLPAAAQTAETPFPRGPVRFIGAFADGGTSDLIQRTSEMLKDNSAAIQQQAASATIGLPQLQAAFANIYATMDSIDAFKLQALDSMSTTITTLEGEVSKSREYLDRVSRADQRLASGALDLEGGGSGGLR